jgi:ParB family chromosome partitioning protein
VSAGQGRGPEASMSPAGLIELVSSIGTLGMLQPILVEELPDGQRRLVAGERRLRAARLGGNRQPDNVHFNHVPALVCTGPLSETDRRTWQVVENLARADLQPGELAEALLYQRCALMQERLCALGVEVPEALATMDDPVVRFRGLDQLRTRAGQHHMGAPWRDVLGRLGTAMSEDTARRLVRAFAHLPVELSAAMDAHEVALATRLEFVQLGRRDGEETAVAIWEALEQAGRVDLLRGAVRQCIESPGLEPGEAILRATELHERADKARAGQATEADCVEAELLAKVGESLRALLVALRAGARLERYDAGSLRMWAEELLGRLTGPGTAT